MAKKSAGWLSKGVTGKKAMLTEKALTAKADAKRGEDTSESDWGWYSPAAPGTAGS